MPYFYYLFDNEMQTHPTKGIVLKTTKYGDTSLVVSIFTQRFGIQKYLVKGVRENKKKSQARGNMFLPASMLDMIVYKKENFELQYMREFSWDVAYKNIFQNVYKNAVATYIVELLYNCLKQPEENEPLYDFVVECLVCLDATHNFSEANLPVWFALRFLTYLGFAPQAAVENGESHDFYFDLITGLFTHHRPHHFNVVEGPLARQAHQLFSTLHVSSIQAIPMNVAQRRELLQAIENYYKIHFQDYTPLKSLAVLSAILN